MKKEKEIQKDNLIQKKTIFIKFEEKDGSPDGMTTDIKNNLWVCHYRGATISVYNLKGKKIGVEYEAYGLTGRNALRLNTVLQNYCSIEDMSELITKLRVIKSDEEISYVKKAASLADKALDEVWKHAKTGVSESKILAEMNRVIFEGGGDYPANEFIIGSGTVSYTHLTLPTKRIV